MAEVHMDPRLEEAQQTRSFVKHTIERVDRLPSWSGPNGTTVFDHMDGDMARELIRAGETLADLGRTYFQLEGSESNAPPR